MTEEKEEKYANEFDLINDLLDHCEEKDSCCCICDDCIMINDRCKYFSYFYGSKIEENVAVVEFNNRKYYINFCDKTELENGIKIKINFDGNLKYDEFYLFIGEHIFIGEHNLVI